MNTDVMFSSASVEWETPQDLFDQLNKEFNFTLDVCATAQNAKCPNYIPRETDGLAISWEGRTCWMNPPYGREIGKWIEKAKMESLAGATVVCLLPARTDTRWFHDFIWNENMKRPQGFVSIRFIKGRLKFGGASNSAPFPSMIVVFRPSSDIKSPTLSMP